MNDSQDMSNHFHWYQDNPNQGREANFVGLTLMVDDQPQPGLLDTTPDRNMCVICNIEKDINFTLWGACNDSFFGK